MKEPTKTDLLRVVRDDVWNLTTSPLYTYRKTNNYYPVLGEGDHDAKIVFIGEAPGKTEAETGRPFCGAAGRVLDGLLATIELERKSVYVTNIVKDRPPENRDPELAEIALYAPFLIRQIEIIKPQILATLGRFSMKFILEAFNLPEQTQSITALHGKVLTAQASYGPVQIVALYHPAVAIYNINEKKTLEKDFQALKSFL